MSGKIKMAMIGLGARGYGLLDTAYLEHPEAEFCAVCDVYEDRVKAAADLIEKVSGKRPFETLNYKEIWEMPEVEAVILCTSWDNHIDLCIEAMEHGKYVGCEVGGAYSLRECWKIVEAYERTGIPVMLLENCVYGRDEMMVYHMAKLGVLGEIVHCEGGYKHDLREEIAFGREKRHYRLDNYIHRNTENYPTHEIGPIARILDINRGNRMLTINSVATRAAGLKAYIQEHKADDTELRTTDFKQGDVVSSIIKCANGETIVITLDTTLPRYYSRGFTVQGTKGMYTEDNRSIYLDGHEHGKDHFDWTRDLKNCRNKKVPKILKIFGKNKAGIVLSSPRF